RGRGEPLPAAARGFFEPRFGHDFSQVRVHADPEAGRLSRALRAHAFARGQHIFFGPGRYQPDTHTGRQLLAHEPTHTLQQRRGAVPAGAEAVQRQDVLATAPNVPPIVNDVLHTPGQPLDHATCTSFGSRFGHDFSRVRVHTDARAVASARAV